MSEVPVADAATAGAPPGATGPVGTPDVPGPLQLERAWHGLMWTMAKTQTARMKTINSTAKHLRNQMKAR